MNNIILPLDKIEVQGDELLMVHGGYVPTTTGTEDIGGNCTVGNNCDVGCSCNP